MLHLWTLDGVDSMIDSQIGGRYFQDLAKRVVLEKITETVFEPFGENSLNNVRRGWKKIGENVFVSGR